MATGTLTIDLAAIAANWQALNRLSDGKAAAVVKADAYGLGIAPVARALAEAGARTFFVAVAEEGPALRAALGPEHEIAVFSGHMEGDTQILRDHALIPLLNAPEQIARHRAALPGHPFGLQLDSGMSRLGLQPADWPDAPKDAWLVMSHLACADDPHIPRTPRNWQPSAPLPRASPPPAHLPRRAASCWAKATALTAPVPASASMAACPSRMPGRSSP